MYERLHHFSMDPCISYWQCSHPCCGSCNNELYYGLPRALPPTDQACAVLSHSLSFVPTVSKHSAPGPLGGHPHSDGFSHTVKRLMLLHLMLHSGGIVPVRLLSCRYSWCRPARRVAPTSVHVLGMELTSQLCARLRVYSERADTAVQNIEIESGISIRPAIHGCPISQV